MSPLHRAASPRRSRTQERPSPRRGGPLGALTTATLVTAGLLVVAGHRWLGPARRPAEPSAAVGLQPHCRAENGERRSYVFASEVRALGVESDVDRFAGVLSLASVAASEARVRFEGGLSEIRLVQGLARVEDRIQHGLQEGFAIEVDPSTCRILDFEMPATWSDEARALVGGLLRAHEYVLGAGPAWEVDQTDGMGSYRAKYRLEGSEVSRTKSFYRMEGAENFGFGLQILGSRMRAQFGPDGRLLRSEGRERVRLTHAGEVAADLEQVLSLVRDDARFLAPSVATLVAGSPFQGSAPADDRLPEAPEDGALARAHYDVALGTLSGMTVAQARTLAGLLAAHPELVWALASELESSLWSEDQRANAFWALELAASPEAKAALTQLLDAPDPHDRVRAAIALAGAGEPSVEVGQALVDLHGRAEQPRVANAALLAVGTLAERGGAEVKAWVKRTLQEALTDAAPGPDTRAALDAIGNAGDPSFLPAVSDALADADPRTRARAAGALRRMGDVGVPALQAALEAEANPEAALAMARTLRELGAPEPASISWAEGQLLRVGPDARAELIHWLGASIHPEAQEVLGRHFRAETSGRLRQLVGRYLPASALVGYSASRTR